MFFVDHEVVDLHAYDPQGMFVSYSLQTDGPFNIDPDLGRIFVNGSLDREVSSQSVKQFNSIHVVSYR